MDRLGPGLPRRLHDGRHHEVALRRRRRADAHRLVGVADMETCGVGLGIDGDSTHTELPAGADHADGDLAPVGDQDLREHGSGF